MPLLQLSAGVSANRIEATNLNTHVDAYEDCTYAAYPARPNKPLDAKPIHIIPRIPHSMLVSDVILPTGYIYRRATRRGSRIAIVIGIEQLPSCNSRYICINATSIFQNKSHVEYVINRCNTYIGINYIMSKDLHVKCLAYHLFIYVKNIYRLLFFIIFILQ